MALEDDEEIDWDVAEPHEQCRAVDAERGFGPCIMHQDHPYWTGHMDSLENEWEIPPPDVRTQTQRRRQTFNSLGDALSHMRIRSAAVIARIEAIVAEHIDEWREEARQVGAFIEYWVPPSEGYIAIGIEQDDLNTNGRVFAYVYPNRVKLESGEVRRVV